MCQLKSEIEKRIAELEQDAQANELMPAFNSQNLNGRYQELQKLRKQIISCDKYNLVEWLEDHIDWSESTFGSGGRTVGLCKNIHKGLQEIEQAPNDLMEWIDVVILALDGAWRAGHSPESIANALWEKQQINFARKWERTPEDTPTEHNRHA